MIKIKWIVTYFLFSVTSIVSAQVKLSNTDLIKVDIAVLENNKKLLANKDATLSVACKQLLQKADKILKFKPVSVMDKMDAPPSGDKHDYISIAPYWWPDSSKKNGVPYIRKDGVVNPEVKNYSDKNNMPKVCEYVYFLGLAYFYSNDEKYAAHASKLLQVWFLDEATKMNPNLNFGQFIKGRNDGRGAGIIDTRQFIFAIDGVNLIKKSKAWSSKNQAGLQKWFSVYLGWLTTSPIGKDELDANNNHGVWYDAQAITFADFIGDREKVKQIITRATNRLDVQMNKDGFFPLELERTTSLHYSTFILNAFVIIAQVAEKNKIDFWETQTKNGYSLKKAVDAILPYISKEKDWFGPQIKPFKFEDAYPLFIRAASKLNCSSCTKTLETLAGTENIIYKLL